MSDQTQTTLDFSVDPGSTEVKVQVAPLVDIVLFLIFFYLVVGQLVMSQKDPSVNLAAMSSPLSQTEQPSEMVINIRADGTASVDGLAVGPDRLPGLIETEMAKAQKRGQGLRVVVRADRQGRFDRLDEVLEACRRCGLSSVVFRAREESLP